MALAGNRYEWLPRFDNRVLDLATSLVRPPPDERIVIVEIDDRALREIGAWPWPRSTHARLLDAIDSLGARLIVLDVLFVEPTAAAEDAALAAAMRRAGTVILPHGFDRVPNTLDSYRPVPPLPELAAAARGVGHAAAQPDLDGVLRRFALTQEAGGEALPHLSVRALAALGRPLPDGRHGSAIASQAPVIPFHPTGSFVSISAADVIGGRLPRGLLRGKSVLVGATAAGLGDRYPVPGDGIELMAGVETQANLISALSAGKVIFPAPAVAQPVVAFLSLLALYLAFWFLPPRYGLLCTAALSLALFALTVLLVPLAGRWLQVASILAAVTISYPLWSWRRLSAVSAYLDREAGRMGPRDAPSGTGGMDYIARQVARMRQLVRNVEDSLAFLRQLIEAAPDAIVVLDRDGMTRMANAQAKALLPVSDRGEAWAFGELVSASGASLDNKAGELATADGRVFLLAEAIFGQEGGGRILALREVTDLRRREEERRQMLEFLSHDMRAPQAAIIGLVQQAGSEFRGAKTDEPRTLDRIRHQAERTLKLADDFVQLARLEETQPDPVETDLVSLAEEACDRFYAIAKGRRVEIRQQSPTEAVWAMVDPPVIARVLDNLLSNAIRHSPPDGVVTVALERRDADFATVTVTDRGSGFAAERLADPFARFGHRGAGAGPSAGLGLAFVKRAIEAHGGTVVILSSPGEGASVAVTLPMAPAAT
ncbi:CHASE2 domain-containing protein [Parerythrobacter aurantius]|uniref:CHASE2 domain-containing protein n=1 Tax=Parerythrobacter aurantius TaxID=3127706 RepID=UPI00324D8F33